MADNVENLILEHLRAIRADIGGIKDDVREIKQRLTSQVGRAQDVPDMHPPTPMNPPGNAALCPPPALLEAV